MQNNDYFSNEIPFLTMETSFDSSLTRALLKFQFKKLVWVLILAPIIMILAGIVFVSESELFLGIVFITVGALMPLLTWGMALVTQKNLDKSEKIMGTGTKVYYEFYENYFKQTIDKGDDFDNVSKLKYTMLYMAFRTKDYYFLYPSQGQAYVLPSQNMSDSEKIMLNDILEKHLGKKFKIC